MELPELSLFGILGSAMSTPYCTVFVTVSNKKEATQLSKTILKDKLCACVNTVPSIQSQYWWKGNIEMSSESLLIIKTKKNLLTKLIKKINSAHSYDVPEVIALPILKGNPAYLNWVGQSVK